MSTFPGDMSIGWGFGIEGELSSLEPQESQQADPLLAVSELEQRVEKLESYLQADPAFLPYGQLEQRIIDLEQRLRSLTLVTDELVKNSGTMASWQMEHDAVSADSVYAKEGETN